MKFHVIVCLLPVILAGPLGAQPNFVDDFEPSGVDGNIWTAWPEQPEDGITGRMESDMDHNHTDEIGATYSAEVVEADPHAYCMYADFGAQAGDVYAEVWVWDDLDDDGLDFDRPVSNMLALIGEAGSPETYTDYLQLGVVAWYDADGFSDTYSVRTKHRDGANLSYIDLGVPRKVGWTKLAIAADALADGGQVRFFIDDELVFVSYREPGVNLQFVRLGVNFKSYDFFWYDDVLVNDTMPPDNFLRFDTDDDGDVDHEDFARFQACISDVPGGNDPSACWRMDNDEDGNVDGDDLAAFEACATGPGIPADPACDSISP